MTIGPTPQCVTCARFRSYVDTGEDMPTCTAFPDGVPDAIWSGTYDHRQEYSGDHGLRWTPLGDAIFPEWALADKTDSPDTAPDDEAAVPT